MFNRIGAAAGKYFGKHILEGDLSYDNRMYHRYGVYAPAGFEREFGAGDMNDYGDARVAVRFGDDFQDLSRTNFEIALNGGMFFDHSDWSGYNEKARQMSLGARRRSPADSAAAVSRSKRAMNGWPGRNPFRKTPSS